MPLPFTDLRWRCSQQKHFCMTVTTTSLCFTVVGNKLHPKSSPSVLPLVPPLDSVCCRARGGTGSLFACHCWPLCGIETKAIVRAATKRDTLALGPPYFLTLLMPWYGAAPSLTPTHTPAHDPDGGRITHTYTRRQTHTRAPRCSCCFVAVFQIWHM